MTTTIRQYAKSDRAAVRHICFLTGYMGQSIEPQWSDEESFANVFSSYYTDREPESLLVAERDGTAVGYLFGCRDTKRSAGTTRPFVEQLLLRQIGFRRGTSRFVRRSIADSIADLLRREIAADRVLDRRWPAHLHINLLPDAREQGLGSELVDRWLSCLIDEGTPGCHLQTLAENARAIAFFASCGFERAGPPKPVPGLRATDGTRHHVQLMVTGLPRAAV